MQLRNFGVGWGEGSVFCEGGRFLVFFLKCFKKELQSFGVVLVQINTWAQIPTPVYISDQLNMFWRNGVCFFVFFSCCFDFFVLFYGHLLLIEILKSLLFHAPTRQVFPSSCTSLFTSQPQLWVSEDLARMPSFDYWFGFGRFLALFVETCSTTPRGVGIRKWRCFIIQTYLWFFGWYSDGHHNQQSALQL